MTDQSPQTADAPNEILAAVADAKVHAAAAPGKAKAWPLATIGIAAGIGSAAIAGAVLFANRDKKRK